MKDLSSVNLYNHERRKFKEVLVSHPADLPVY